MHSFFTRWCPHCHRARSKLGALNPLLYLLMVPVLMVAGCETVPLSSPPPTYVFVPQPSPTVSPTDYYTVTRGTIEESLKVRGRVTSAQAAPLFFKQGGFLKAVNAKSGQLVRQDELLAETEPTGSSTDDELVELDYQIQLKRIEVEEAKAEPIDEQVLRSETDVKKSEVDLQQAQAAYDQEARKGDGAAAFGQAFELHRATLNRDAAQAAYEAAQAQRHPRELRIRYLETELALLQSRLDRTLARARQAAADAQLKAPFSGLVVSMDKHVGDAVSPYEPIGQLADPARLRVEATLVEPDLLQVSFGLPVSITLDAYPGQSLAGKIVAISPQPIVWQGRNAYQATIDFDDPSIVPATIMMGADVRILARATQNVLVVPAELITVDGDRQYVEVLNGSSWERSEIGTGITDGRQTAVLWGLSEGDKLRLR